jgi:hypothetical protein
MQVTKQEILQKKVLQKESRSKKYPPTKDPAKKKTCSKKLLPKKLLQVSELHFYMDRICKTQISGVAIAGKLHEEEDCFLKGTCEKYSVEKIYDNDIDTGYKVREL